MEVINVCTPGHLDYADSYGLIAIQLIRHLTELGIHVNVVARGQVDHPNCPPDVNEIAHRPYRKSDATVFMGYPTSIDKFPEHTRLGKQVIVTMFESSKVPATWPPILNTMDAVITPSTFCADVFRSCGVTAPVHTISLGIGDLYKPYKRPQRQCLTFLAFLDRGARKGGLAAQQAFLLAFGDDPDYHLILKMRKPKVQMELLNENMTLIQRDMTEQELYELYCSADVMIFPTKGEGFGLPCREFAGTGGISLATDWGGTADNIDAWGWPLPYKLVPADWAGHSTFGGQDLGMWAEPSIEGIAEALHDVAQNRSVYSAYAEHAAENVCAMYSWRRFSEQVLDVWKGVS